MERAVDGRHCSSGDMQTYTISKTARLFGLSRSALLYYDRVGLLSPRHRTPAGYRMYTEEDVERLERISILRRAGLSIEAIGTILDSGDKPYTGLLQKRMKEIGEEMLALGARQRLLSEMLKGAAVEEEPPRVNKEMWIEMLRASGMGNQGMERWHTEFERRAPEAHHAFLLSLGISEEEVRSIRRWADTTAAGEENDGTRNDD